MIQSQLKLKLTKAQERTLEQWLYHLTSVWNWAIRKIELDAKDGIYYSRMEFQNLLAGHSKKLGIPGHVIEGILLNAHDAWKRCFKKVSGRPHLKGRRNKLSSILFHDPIKRPFGGRVGVLGMRSIRFHKQDIPEGRIKCGRIVKRASGWYLCLFIDAEPKAIPQVAHGVVGIDPGFKHLLTLSTGEKIEHPRELEASAERLAQAQRGYGKKLSARLHERMANQRKDRNHKLSRRLVAENQAIVWSKDSINGLAKVFGKSVRSSGHGQLRAMLAYKSRAGGRQFIEVPGKFSTKTCSACGSLSGPTGWAGLSVRRWVCAVCGTAHDRDVNAAMNTLIAGVGSTHESHREMASGIAA
jgi:transposase